MACLYFSHIAYVSETNCFWIFSISSTILQHWIIQMVNSFIKKSQYTHLHSHILQCVLVVGLRVLFTFFFLSFFFFSLFQLFVSFRKYYERFSKWSQSMSCLTHCFKSLVHKSATLFISHKNGRSDSKTRLKDLKEKQKFEVFGMMDFSSENETELIYSFCLFIANKFSTEFWLWTESTFFLRFYRNNFLFFFFK